MKNGFISRLAEAVELLTAHENKLAECERNINDLTEQAKSEQLTLEKNLRPRSGRLIASKQRESVLQEKIDLLIDQCHQAELRAAIAETKIEKNSG